MSRHSRASNILIYCEDKSTANSCIMCDLVSHKRQLSDNRISFLPNDVFQPTPSIRYM